MDADDVEGSLADESESLDDWSDESLDEESSTDDELGLPDEDGLLDELLLEESVTVE